MSASDNLALYSNERVVSYYEKLSGLQPAEQYLFDKYIPGGSNVVDIGVGAGRTTPWLSKRAAQYLGVDYSQAMVNTCRARFPHLDFKHGDATNLSFLADATFDATIFSFNGIDSIPTNRERLRCLSEMRRIAKPDGVVILSSHNAKRLADYPSLAGADLARKLWRIGRTIARTPAIAARALRSKAFFEGGGYIFDSAHGGTNVHVSTPKSIEHDANSNGLSIVETVGGHYPARVPEYLTNWYYYVLRASADTKGDR